MATHVTFPPPRIAAVWSTLSQGVRAGLGEEGIVSAAVFRNLFHGSVEEAADVAREFGGVLEDAPILVDIWSCTPDAQSKYGTL